jgi:subtilase family serine protease
MATRKQSHRSLWSRRRSRRALLPFLEGLESRLVLAQGILAPSVALGSLPVASPFDANPAQQSPGPAGYTPIQIQTAYGLSTGTAYNNNISFGSALGNGAGQTIGIFAQGYNPAFVSTYLNGNPADGLNPAYSSSALAVFDAKFGLPDPPSLTFVDHNGIPLSFSNNSTNNPDFLDYGEGAEIALDIEWAHAMAPQASIVVLSAPGDLDIFNPDDSIVQGMATLAGLPGVSVVSSSYVYFLDAFGLESLEQTWDSTILAPAAAANPNVSFFASSGDYFSVTYPAASPEVVSVGATTLNLTSTGQWSSETGWSDSGGGFSQAFTEPSYQDGVQNSGMRSNPDVAADGDPSTGVAVYDPYDFGTATPWDDLGGTSLSAQLWAGMMSIVDQGRVLAGGQPLGATQALTDLYSLPSADFHDITVGNNGFPAGPGYDPSAGSARRERISSSQIWPRLAWPAARRS